MLRVIQTEILNEICMSDKTFRKQVHLSYNAEDIFSLSNTVPLLHIIEWHIRSCKTQQEASTIWLRNHCRQVSVGI